MDLYWATDFRQNLNPVIAGEVISLTQAAFKWSRLSLGQTSRWSLQIYSGLTCRLCCKKLEKYITCNRLCQV